MGAITHYFNLDARNGEIWFNGKCSSSIGVVVEEFPEMSRGTRRGNIYQIAGRNGDHVQEDYTFDNYTQTYKIAIMEEGFSYPNPALWTAEVASWLLGSSGYCRLEDSFSPNLFRYARFAGPLNIAQLMDQCGRATISFDCRPERYYTSGEKAYIICENADMSKPGYSTITQTLHNLTQFDAAPLIRVTGTGSFVIRKPAKRAADAMIIGIELDDDTPQTIEIDCESYEIRFVTIAAGTKIYIDASDKVRYLTTYPTLARLGPGDNTIALEGYDVMKPAVIQKCEIIPRWWTI